MIKPFAFFFLFLTTSQTVLIVVVFSSRLISNLLEICRLRLDVGHECTSYNCLLPHKPKYSVRDTVKT